MSQGLGGTLILVAGLAFFPGRGDAQAITGLVVDQESQPVPGVMIRVMSGDAFTGRLTLTGADGRYRIELDSAGTYHLSVERIGFERSQVGPVQVVGSTSRTVDIKLTARAISLPGLSIEAESDRRCVPDPSEDGQTQIVWDQARTALRIAASSEELAPLSFDVIRRERTMDRRGDAVLQEQQTRTTAVGTNSIRTLPPDDLLVGGYVREEDGYVHFYGPDENVLLSDSFLDTHCFYLREDTGHPHEVGLGFEPIAGRDTTDIEGTIWVDTASFRLSSVSFSYTGLRLPGEDLAGGEVHFRELPDGRWVIERWLIRAPVLEMRRPSAGLLGTSDRVMVTGVREFSSQIAEINGPEGWSWRNGAATGSIQGLAWNDVADGPLAGAIVFVENSEFATESDAAGRWTIEDVPAGSYRIGLRHPLADSLGYGPLWQTVEIAGDTTVATTVRVPTLTNHLSTRCGDSAAGRIVGVVLDNGEEPLAGATVRVVDGLPPGSAPVEATTERDGRYHLCGLPLGSDVTVAARVGPLHTFGVEVAIRSLEPARVDLRFSPGSTTGTTNRDEGEPRFVRGDVLSADSLRPIPGALVELLGPGDSVAASGLSDSSGQFVIAVTEAGPFRVRATHLAFAASESEERLIPSDGVSLRVHMSTQAIELEGMVVEVERRIRKLELSGFYRRERMGLGSFLDRQAIEHMVPNRPSDVLSRMPHLSPLPTSGATAGVGPVFVFNRARALWGNCPPALYVDGALMRSGGRTAPSIDDLVPQDVIEAMEFFPSGASVPAQYTGPGSNCGVILIWTR